MLIVLKLLANALAVALVLWTFFLFGFLLYLALCWWWERRTGSVDAVAAWFGQLKAGYIAGLAAVLWYAAYAARVVQLESDAARHARWLLHGGALLGVLAACAVADTILRRMVKLYRDGRVTGALGGAALAVHGALLTLPALADPLGRAWARVVEAALIAAISQ